MKEKTPVEKRRYVRLDMKARIACTALGGGAKAPSQAIRALARNMSVDGICFTSDKPLTPGRTLQMTVALPQERRQLRLTGEVRWSSPVPQPKGKARYDIGVKLNTIDKSDENRFITYICDKMSERLSRYLYL